MLTRIIISRKALLLPPTQSFCLSEKCLSYWASGAHRLPVLWDCSVITLDRQYSACAAPLIVRGDQRRFAAKVIYFSCMSLALSGLAPPYYGLSMCPGVVYSKNTWYYSVFHFYLTKKSLKIKKSPFLSSNWPVYTVHTVPSSYPQDHQGMTLWGEKRRP